MKDVSSLRPSSAAADTADAGVPVPLAHGPLGMELLGFHREPENTRFTDAAVAYVLVALWHEGRLLMVRVRGRDCWELPGGGIEPGETSRQAAVRELWEESGQPVSEEGLRFVGFARTALPAGDGPRRRVLYGALYTAEVSRAEPFVPNEEIAAVHWRDGDEPLEGGRVQTVDEYLAALCRL
ncbi:NUDIX domain-containing protein [Streptomyces carminius]|nr:NUDIX domain-containing protein [Streptomyces carminius]